MVNDLFTADEIVNDCYSADDYLSLIAGGSYED